MKKSVQKELKKIDEKVEDYLATMEFADSKEKKDNILKSLSTNTLSEIINKK